MKCLNLISWSVAGAPKIPKDVVDSNFAPQMTLFVIKSKHLIPAKSIKPTYDSYKNLMNREVSWKNFKMTKKNDGKSF